MLLRAFALSLLLSASLLRPVLAVEEGAPCDVHAHWVVEKDDDQGAVMKRCVCDPGFIADSPDKPCHPVKQEGAGKKTKKASSKK